MKTLRTFVDRMRKQGSRLLQFGTEHRRRIGLAVLTELAMTTPVDEGTARSNWNVALDDSADGPTPAHAPGKGGSTGAANTRAAIAAGTAVIDRTKFWQDIYITNNLPYIAKLNEGSSSQAPAGFVQTAVHNGIKVAQRASGSSNKK